MITEPEELEPSLNGLEHEEKSLRSEKKTHSCSTEAGMLVGFNPATVTFSMLNHKSEDPVSR